MDSNATGNGNGNGNAATGNLFDGADLIHVYTRENALADGCLIDVSAAAKEAGIKWPVALTAAVHAQYVKVPLGVACQDEAGRLWDIVWMLANACRRASGNTLFFTLHVRNDNRERMPPLVRLKAIAGPLAPDDPAPCLTVMLPDED